MSQPYRWEHNFHLAFRAVRGARILMRRSGIIARIENAEEIRIKELGAEARSLPYADDPDYHTCRNWRFAVMVASGEARIDGEE